LFFYPQERLYAAHDSAVFRFGHLLVGNLLDREADVNQLLARTGVYIQRQRQPHGQQQQGPQDPHILAKGKAKAEQEKKKKMVEPRPKMWRVKYEAIEKVILGHKCFLTIF
jgi:hypothetical protein